MALLPPNSLTAVVALGQQSTVSQTSFNATGFLYGHPAGFTDDAGNKQYSLFLITNRHVLEAVPPANSSLVARFNATDGASSKLYKIRLRNDDGSDRWTVHPNHEMDVGVVRLNHQVLTKDGIEFDFFPGDDQSCTLEQARTNGVSEGDGLFVLGFPLGEAGDDRNYVIVRQGIIARIQHCLKGSGQTFLIDSSIFPGNSGGPVLLKPELAAIQGTQANKQSLLIGMISAYMPYKEVAVSQQTGRPRMVFEENSGLGIVVPVDIIQEAIKAANNKITTASQS